MIIGIVIVGVIAMGIWSFLNRRATSDNGNFQHISAREAYALIQEHNSDADFVILDVRTPAEFGQGHIKNAINIDFYANTFRSQLEKLDKQKMYLVYCRSGNRSGKTLPLLKQLDFQHAYNMQGGIGQWAAQQLPLNR